MNYTPPLIQPYIPTFPISSLPPSIQSAVWEVQSKTQAPMALVAASALGAISLACQNSVDVCRLNGLISPCSLYLITLADSGERKSTVDSLLMQAITAFDADQTVKATLAHAQYKTDKKAFAIEQKVIEKSLGSALKNNNENTEEVRKKLTEFLSTEPVKPKQLRLVYNDATPDAIKVSLHENSSSIGIISDEAGVVFSGRVLRDLGLINQLWSGSQLHIDRADESFVVLNPRLTLSLMVQKGVLDEYLEVHGKSARDIGFFARNLICYPTTTQGSRYIAPAPTFSCYPAGSLDKFHSIINELLNQNVTDVEKGVPRAILKFSPEAQNYWTNWYNGVESAIGNGGYLCDIKDYASKAAENLARLAALFHFFEGMSGDISYDTVYRAATICNWYMDEFKRLFSPAQEMPIDVVDANEMEQWLRNLLYQHPGWNEIEKNHLARFGPNHLRKDRSRREAGIQFLAFNNKLQIVQRGKTSWIQLNPQFFLVPSTFPMPYSQALTQQQFAY